MLSRKISAILIIILFINLPLATAISYSISGRQVSDFPDQSSQNDPVCGDNKCEGEEPYYCKPDCEPKQEPEKQPVEQPRPVLTGFCGDKYCDLEGMYTKQRENTITCPEDCAKTKEELVQPTCSDTDGDVQPFKKGTVSGITILGEKYSDTDECLIDNTGKLFLKEYYCYQGYAHYEDVFCPEGYSCFDGACQPLKCEDSAEGALYSYPDGRQLLQENKCQGNNLLKFNCGGYEVVECAYGCNTLTNSCFDKSKKSSYCIELRSPQPKGVEAGESWLDDQGKPQTKGASYPDYCDDKTLNSYTCEGAIVRLRTKFCPNGCNPAKQECNPMEELSTPIPEEKSSQKFFENLQQGLVCLKQCPDCMDKPQPPKGINCDYLLSSGTWLTLQTPKWPEFPKEKDPTQQAVSIIAEALKQSSCDFNPNNYDKEEPDDEVKIDLNKNLKYTFKDKKTSCYECYFDFKEKKLSLKDIACNLSSYDYNLDSEDIEKTNLITGRAVDPQKELFEAIYGGVISFIEGLMNLQGDNNAVKEINSINQCLPPLDPEIKKAIDYLSTCSDDSAIIALMNAVNQINLAGGNVNDAYNHLIYGASPFTQETIAKLFDPEGFDTDFALKLAQQKGEKQKAIDLETLQRSMKKITPSNLRYDLQDSIKTFDNVNNQAMIDSIEATIGSMMQSSCPKVNDFLKEAQEQIEMTKFYNEEFKKGLNKAKEYLNQINDDIRNSIFNAMLGNTFVNYAAHQNIRASLSGMKAAIALLNAVLESVKCVACPFSQAKYTNDEGKCVECAKCGPGRTPAVSSQLSLPRLRQAELAKALQEGDYENVKKIIDKLKGQEVAPKEKAPIILKSEQKGLWGRFLDWMAGVKTPEEKLAEAKKTILDPNKSINEKKNVVYDLVGLKGSETDFQDLKELLFNPNVEDEVKLSMILHLYIFLNQENYLKQHPELADLIKKGLASSMVRGNEGAFIEILSWYDTNHLIELFKNPEVNDLTKIYLIEKLIELKKISPILGGGLYWEAQNFLKKIILEEKNRKYFRIITAQLIAMNQLSVINEAIIKLQLTETEMVELTIDLLTSRQLLQAKEILKRIPNLENILKKVILLAPSRLHEYYRVTEAILLLEEMKQFDKLIELLNRSDLHSYYKIMIADILSKHERLDKEILLGLGESARSLILDMNVPLEIRIGAVRLLVKKEGLESFKAILLDSNVNIYMKRTIIEALSTLDNLITSDFLKELISNPQIDLEVKKEILFRGVQGLSYYALKEIALNKDLPKLLRDLAVVGLLKFDISLIIAELKDLSYGQRVSWLKEIILNKEGLGNYQDKLSEVLKEIVPTPSEEDSVEIFNLIKENFTPESAMRVLSEIRTNHAFDILEKIIREKISREPFENSALKRQLTEANLDILALILLINTFNYWSETGENANIRSSSYRARDYMLELLGNKIKTSGGDELAKYYDMAKSFLLPKYFQHFIKYVTALPLEKSIEELKKIYNDDALIERLVNESGLSYTSIMELIINALSVNDERAIQVIEEISNNPEEEEKIRESARKIVEHFRRFEKIPTKEKEVGLERKYEPPLFLATRKAGGVQVPILKTEEVEREEKPLSQQELEADLTERINRIEFLIDLIESQIAALSKHDWDSEELQIAYMNLIKSIELVQELSKSLPDSDSPYAPKPKIINTQKRLTAELINLIVRKKIPPAPEIYDFISRIEDIGLRESLLRLLRFTFEGQVYELPKKVLIDKQVAEAIKRLEPLIEEIEVSYNVHLIEEINDFLNENPDATAEEIIDAVQNIQASDSIEVFEGIFKVPPSLEEMQAGEEKFKYEQRLAAEIELAFRRAAYGRESSLKWIARKILGLLSFMSFDDPYTINEPNTKAFTELINNIEAENDLILVKKIYEFVTHVLPVFESALVMCRSFETLITEGKGTCRERAPLLVYALKLRGINAKIVSSNPVGEGPGHMWVTVIIKVNNKLVEFDLDPTWYREFIPLHERFKGVEEEREKFIRESFWKQYESQGRSITEPRKQEKPKETSAPSRREEAPFFLETRKAGSVRAPVLKDELQEPVERAQINAEEEVSDEEIIRACELNINSTMKKALEFDYYKRVLELCGGLNLMRNLEQKVLEKLKDEYPLNSVYFLYYLEKFSPETIFSEIKRIYEEDKIKLTLHAVLMIVKLAYDNPLILDAVENLLTWIVRDEVLEEDFRNDVKKNLIYLDLYWIEKFKGKPELDFERNSMSYLVYQFLTELKNEFREIEYAYLLAKSLRGVGEAIDIMRKLKQNFKELSFSDQVLLIEIGTEIYAEYGLGYLVTELVAEIDRLSSKEDKESLMRVLITYLGLQRETERVKITELIQKIVKDKPRKLQDYADKTLILLREKELETLLSNLSSVDSLIVEINKFVKDFSGFFSSEDLINFIQDVQGRDTVDGKHINDVKTREETAVWKIGLFYMLARNFFKGNKFARILFFIGHMDMDAFRELRSSNEPLTNEFLEIIRNIKAENDLELVIKIYFITSQIIKIYEEHDEICKTMEELLLTGKGVCRDYATFLYHALKERGIEVEPMTGYEHDYYEGHAWVKVKIRVNGVPVEFDIDPTNYEEFFPLHPRVFEEDIQAREKSRQTSMRTQQAEAPLFLATRKSTASMMVSIADSAGSPPQNFIMESANILGMRLPAGRPAVMLFSDSSEELESSEKKSEEDRLAEEKLKIFDDYTKNPEAYSPTEFLQLLDDFSLSNPGQIFGDSSAKLAEIVDSFIKINSRKLNIDQFISLAVWSNYGIKSSQLLDRLIENFKILEETMSPFEKMKFLNAIESYSSYTDVSAKKLVDFLKYYWGSEELGLKSRLYILLLLLKTQSEYSDNVLNELVEIFFVDFKKISVEEMNVELLTDSFYLFGFVLKKLPEDLAKEIVVEVVTKAAAFIEEPSKIDSSSLIVQIPNFYRFFSDFVRSGRSLVEEEKLFMDKIIQSLLKIYRANKQNPDVMFLAELFEFYQGILSSDEQERLKEELFEDLINVYKNSKKEIQLKDKFFEVLGFFSEQDFLMKEDKEFLRSLLREILENYEPQNSLKESVKFLIFDILKILDYPEDLTAQAVNTILDKFIMTRASVAFSNSFQGVRIAFAELVQLIDKITNKSLIAEKVASTVVLDHTMQHSEAVVIYYRVVKEYLSTFPPKIAETVRQRIQGLQQLFFFEAKDKGVFFLSLDEILEYLPLEQKLELLSSIRGRIFENQSIFAKKPFFEDFFRNADKYLEKRDMENVMLAITDKYNKGEYPEKDYLMILPFMERYSHSDEYKKYGGVDLFKEFIRIFLMNPFDVEELEYLLNVFDKSVLLENSEYLVQQRKEIDLLRRENVNDKRYFEELNKKLLRLDFLTNIVNAVLKQKIENLCRSGSAEEMNKFIIAFLNNPVLNNSLEFLAVCFEKRSGELSGEILERSIYIINSSFRDGKNFFEYAEKLKLLPARIAVEELKRIYQDTEYISQASERIQNAYENFNDTYFAIIKKIIDTLNELNTPESTEFIKIISENPDEENSVRDYAKQKLKLDQVEEVPTEQEKSKETSMRTQKAEVPLFLATRKSGGVQAPILKDESEESSSSLIVPERPNLLQEYVKRNKPKNVFYDPVIVENPLLKRIVSLGGTLTAVQLGDDIAAVVHEVAGHGQVLSDLTITYEVGINYDLSLYGIEGVFATDKYLKEYLKEGGAKGAVEWDSDAEEVTPEQRAAVSMGGIAASQQMYCKLNKVLEEMDDNSFGSKLGHWVAFRSALDFPIYCFSLSGPTSEGNDINNLVKLGYKKDIERALIADVIGKAPDLYWHFKRGLGMEADKPEWFSFRIPGTNFRLKIQARAFIDPRQRVIAPYVEMEIAKE